MGHVAPIFFLQRDLCTGKNFTYLPSQFTLWPSSVLGRSLVVYEYSSELTEEVTAYSCARSDLSFYAVKDRTAIIADAWPSSLLWQFDSESVISGDPFHKVCQFWSFLRDPSQDSTFSRILQRCRSSLLLQYFS
jgi:hypothetical protein